MSVTPGSLDGKEFALYVGDLSSIPGLGRSPGGRQGNPLQYSCLENPCGPRSLAGNSSWGSKELYSTERLSRYTKTKIKWGKEEKLLSFSFKGNY